MTSPDAPAPVPWSILTFRLTSLGTQQRILMAFRDIDRPGVIALGTYDDGVASVVVESPSRSGESYARRVIRTIDPEAVCRTDG